MAVGSDCHRVCYKHPRPLSFATYVSEVDAVIHSHAVQYHQYADELIYLSLVPQAIGDLSSLVNCSDEVSTCPHGFYRMCCY